MLYASVQLCSVLYNCRVSKCIGLGEMPPGKSCTAFSSSLTKMGQKASKICSYLAIADALYSDVPNQLWRNDQMAKKIHYNHHLIIRSYSWPMAILLPLANGLLHKKEQGTLDTHRWWETLFCLTKVVKPLIFVVYIWHISCLRIKPLNPQLKIIWSDVLLKTARNILHWTTLIFEQPMEKILFHSSSEVASAKVKPMEYLSWLSGREVEIFLIFAMLTWKSNGNQRRKKMKWKSKRLQIEIK